MSGRTRLRKELRDAKKAKDENEGQFFLDLKTPENLYQWQCMLYGPKDTPFEEGKFHLDVRIPQEYPLRPPEFRFRTKIFHPNVLWSTGEICLDILKSEWTPVWNLESVCTALLMLLQEPNAESPLNCDAGNVIRANDIRAFNTLARMYTIEHAMDTLLPPPRRDTQGSPSHPGSLHQDHPRQPALRQLHRGRCVCPQRRLLCGRCFSAQDLPLLHGLLGSHEEGGSETGGKDEEHSYCGTGVCFESVDQGERG